MGTVKRLILILAAAVLSVLIVLGNYRQARRDAFIKEFHEAVLELDGQRKQVEQELYDLEERKKARQLCGRGILVFTDPYQPVADQIYSTMQDYEYVGMVAIPPDFKAGEGSFLTAEQLKTLQDADWRFCGYWDGTGEPDKAISHIRELFREYQLGRLRVMCVAEGADRTRLDSVFTDEKITTVIHYGESRPLFAQEETGLRQVGAVCWNHPLVLEVLDEAVNQREEIAMTVDFSTAFGLYDQELFHNMCTILQKHREEFLVTTLDEPTLEQEYLDAFYQARKAYLQEEIARIDGQVKDVYALYDKYGDDMVIPEKAG